MVTNNNQLRNIQPLVGLGDIRFGMSREEIKAILGDPDEIDEYSFTGDEDDLSESWHYDELEVSMSFEAEDDWRLITLAVSSDQYILDDQPIVGLSKDNLLAVLSKLGYQNISEENENSLEMPGHQLVSAADKFLNFWLENGTVKEVQWSPSFDDDDEVHWPE